MHDATLLLRQVHPNFVQRGQITSQVFQPRANARTLSVYDGDKISAEDSWRHYTGELGLRSAGVVAVTVDECRRIGVSAYEDPADFPEHAAIDFDDMRGADVEDAVKRLKAAAQSRGWMYEPANAN